MTGDIRGKLDELLEMYRDELSPQERKALGAIMLSPGLTEREIAVRLKLKGSRPNAILKKLEARGLVKSGGGPPLRYVPQNPKTIFDVLDREHINRETLKGELETVLMQVYEAKVLSNQPPAPENTIEIFSQTDALSWLSDKCQHAMSTIRIVGGDLSILRHNPRLKSELLAKRDTCKIRILTYRPRSGGDDSLIAELKGLDIPTKFSEMHQVPLVVIDEKYVLIGFAQYREDGLRDEVYSCVHAISPALGKTLASTFDYAWDGGALL